MPRTTMELRRINFMREVQTDVWERLDDNGIGITFGGIRDRFLELLRDKSLRDKVVDTFYEHIVSKG